MKKLLILLALMPGLAGSYEPTPAELCLYIRWGGYTEPKATEPLLEPGFAADWPNYTIVTIRNNDPMGYPIADSTALVYLGLIEQFSDSEVIHYFADSRRALIRFDSREALWWAFKYRYTATVETDVIMDRPLECFLHGGTWYCYPWYTFL